MRGTLSAALVIGVAAAGSVASVARARPGAFLGARFAADEGPATIAEVASPSPAARAGLAAGDRLTAIAAAPLPSGRAFLQRLQAAYPGQSWQLRVERGGAAHVTTLTLGTWSAHWRALGTQRPPLRCGDAILIAGQEVPIGAPVVTFRDPGGFDGYALRCAFSEQVLPRRPAGGCNTPERYGTRRGLAPPLMAELLRERGSMSFSLAKRAIDQVVLHYDVAWTSQNCFKVLHDLRGLSCQFLLGVDGTLYQTLDVVERARHAGSANSRSIGIEIAHPGPLELTKDLAQRYTPAPDGRGVVFDLAWLRNTPRTPGFVVRPARPAPVQARVQGRVYSQFDYTDAQYETLTRLLGALSRALPKIRLDAPRDATGAVRDAVLAPAELSSFSGLVGHYHVSSRKQDPGPAFDWARVIRDSRKHAALRE